MSKDNVIQFPDRHSERGVDKLDMIENRISELELEIEFLDGDIEYLQQQLESNHNEVEQLFLQVEKLHQDTLDKKIVEFKSEFGVDINFDADFDLTPEDK